LTSAIRRRPRYGRGIDVARPGEFCKGRATPVVLMASACNARFKADFLCFAAEMQLY
jgi:hypothetical protein